MVTSTRGTATPTHIITPMRLLLRFGGTRTEVKRSSAESRTNVQAMWIRHGGIVAIVATVVATLFSLYCTVRLS
jgi:hypothetical protein